MVKDAEPRKRKEKLEDIILSPGVDFSFNPTTMQFELGSGKKATTIDPSGDVDGEVLRYSIMEEKSPTGEEMVFLMTTGGMVLMPKIREFIAKTAEDYDKARVLNKMIGLTMASLEEGTVPDFSAITSQGSLDARHFLSEFTTNGTVTLKTGMTCACLGANEGMMGLSYPPGSNPREDISLPIGLFPHNLNTAQSRKIITAGIGTLAYFARNGFEN